MQRMHESLFIEEFRGSKEVILMQSTSESLIIEEFRCQRVIVLMQCTSESLIIEEFRGPEGSYFDTAHKRELDY